VFKVKASSSPSILSCRAKVYNSVETCSYAHVMLHLAIRTNQCQGALLQRITPGTSVP